MPDPGVMRLVTGTIRYLDDTAQVGDIVRIRLERVGYDSVAHYMPSDITTEVIDDEGNIDPVMVWCAGEAGRVLLCVLPNGATFRFLLMDGPGSITLQDLHALYTPIEPPNPYLQGLMEGIAEAAVDELRDDLANTSDVVLGDGMIGYVNSLPGAIPSTVNQKLNERVSLLDFYAADGSTTDAEAFSLGVAACATGQQALYIPGRFDPYDFDGAAGLTPIDALVIIGESKETVRIVGASDQDFLTITHNLVLRDLTIDGWRYGVNMAAASTLKVVDVERCAFKNGVYGILSPSLDFDPDNLLDIFRLQNSHFENLTRGGCVMYIGFEQADVAHNTVLNCSRRGIQLGRNFSVAGDFPVTVAQILEYQDKFTNMRVVDNHIRGLTNNNLNEAIHNIICYGRWAVCGLNTVRDCVSNAATTEIGGIYLKTRGYTHVGNVVSNMYTLGAGSVNYFNIKGSKRGADGLTIPTSMQGYNSICIGNHAECMGLGKIAFRIQNGDVLFADNRAEGFTVAGVQVASGITEDEPDDSEGYSNILIANNKLWGADAAVGRTVYGINCTSVGDNIILNGNQITNVEIGVRLTAQALAPRNHHIINNKCTVLRRHGFEFDHVVAVENLFLMGNSVDGVAPTTGNGFGYLFNGSGNILNLWAIGNTATRIRPVAGTATAWFVGSTGTITNGYFWDNPIDDVNPADSSSGYGYRFANTAVANLNLRAEGITNVKTVKVLYSTAPSSWTGEREFTAAYNPPDLADNGVQFTTIAAVGARPADIVRVSFVETTPAGANVAGVRFSADVKVNDVIQVMMENKSGASRNLANGTLTAIVRKPVG